MAHEALDGDDVAAAFKKPGRVGVAEFVEGGMFDAGAVGDIFELPQEVGYLPAFGVWEDPLRGSWQFFQEVRQVFGDWDGTFLVVFG